MNKSESIKNLATALNLAQAEMPPAKMNATNPFLKNKYADLGSVIETAKPILANHGLSVSQFPTGDGSLIGVETILIHTSGEYISNTQYLEATSEKGKSAAQVAGSIISYLRRYAYAAVLGMYADEDTDGNRPTQSPAGKKPAQKKPKTDIATLQYQDGSSVLVGGTDKAKSEQTAFAEYCKAHDGNAPRNIHNLRNWKEQQAKKEQE